MQSGLMQTNWAEENLQTIRTLMERSAMYRRALAPIVIFAGVMGILAAGAGLIFHFDSASEFGGLWLGTAGIVVIGAFFNTRRQAIKDGETLLSPPTRRVAQAMAPPLAAGLIMGLLFLWLWDDFGILLPFVWALFYGCALHSAGFFMARGVRWFGWIYIILVPCALVALWIAVRMYKDLNPHWFMGFFFGVLHLAYGIYLYLTEKGKNAA